MSHENLSEVRTTRALIAAGTLAASVLIAGCGSSESASSATSKDVCSADYARPMPGAATVNSYKDSRRGNVYACWYLLDEAIPFNKPTLLEKLTEATFDESQFSSTSSFGGFLLLGTGGGSGSGSAAGSTEHRDVYAMQILGSDGLYQKLIINSENVRLKASDDPNAQPTITIHIPNEPLFNKNNANSDNESIWRSGNPSTESWKRYNTVEAVSVVLPREQGVHDLNYHGSISGGPKSSGEVVAALATSIVITLPEQMLNNPTQIGN